MKKFSRTTNGFNYVFEYDLSPHDDIILNVPPISANARGVNDIGWQCNGDVTLYGTLSRNPNSDHALWQEIQPYDEVNKTVSAIRIINGAEPCHIIIRAILN